MVVVRNEQGMVYNRLQQPAVVYNAQGSYILKIGELADMMMYFEHVQDAYRSQGFHAVADEICMMQLPNDQEEIDKVFQITNYIGQLHRRSLH